MKKKNVLKRILAIALAVVMVTSGMPDMGRPATVSAAETLTGNANGVISTTDDSQTLTRPVATYGNSTLNAGKILVGKSVTDGRKDDGSGAEPLDISADIAKMPSGTQSTLAPEDGNFLVTVSQSAQMYGVSSKIPVPLDVVFVLDTSASMDTSAGSGQTRLTAVVAAANSAINAVLSANKDNRVGVVAFSNNTSVLSTLNKYSASENHLQIRADDLYGQTGSRDLTLNGTNIHAGVVAGAKLLMGAEENSLQVTYGERTVTRIPVLVVLSDGAPTRLSKSQDWKNPAANNLWDSSSDYVGYGFLTMLAASYYKNAITNKYFGNNASEDQRAFVYTIGVGLGSIDSGRYGYSASNSDALENLTMNPSDWWGVALNGTDRDDDMMEAWTDYQNKEDFAVQVKSNEYYQFKYHATNTAAQYNIDPSVTSLKYNDEYWLASNTTEINKAFSEVVIEIQKRAITVPTATNSERGQHFSGYVSFTDPIGEYMEVKGIKGVTGDGYLYQGKSLAQMAEKYDPNWENMTGFTAEEKTFFAALEQALFDRLKFSNPAGDKDPTMEQIRQILNVVTMTSSEGPVVVDAGGGNTRTFDYDTYGGQLYYTDDSHYGNSFTWFGKLHYLDENVTTENANYNDSFDIGFIGVAPKKADSVNDWLKEAEDDTGSVLAQAKAAGANVIVRSYFMYGTADGTRTNPADMLHFQLRVITNLSEPHQQYVSIKAPASLLAMQSVLIDDTDSKNLVAHYDDLIPTRVTYEVGLRSDITTDNVWSIVDSKYTDEYGNVNADGSINFYTNDFKRYTNANDAAGSTSAEHDHDHAYANATFSVHDSNSFYRYEKDTQLLDAAGKPVTSLETGKTYYYSRTYYEWNPNQATSQDGEHVAPATERTALIPVVMTAGWENTGKIVQTNGYWYIKEGTYTAFTLTSGDDQLKTDNETVSAHIISHPERTNSASDSHYTVWLGNNGRLTFVGVPSKTVHKYDETTLGTANIDGQLVTVGDKLNYQIQATNNYETASQIKIEDTLPAGTKLAEGGKIEYKVGSGEWTSTQGAATYTYDAGKITWNFSSVAAGETVYVRFDVEVTEDAVLVGKLDNKGEITVGNNSHTTNVTTNPVIGKRVADENGNAIEGTVAVGTILEYQIAYYNDTTETADFVITDIIPAGTTYEADSASHAPSTVITDASGKVTALEWKLDDIQPGIGGVITFEVKVDASVAPDENESGLDVENYASIQYANNPVITNSTRTEVQTGELVLTKVVVPAPTGEDLEKEFELLLTEDTGKLSGTYSGITFDEGKAVVKVKHNQSVTISGLPVGVIITVTEPAPGAGYTAAITSDGRVTVVNGTTPTAVTVTNTYDAADTALILGGTKVFINQDIYEQNRSFTFELKESTDPTAAGGGVSSQAVNLSAGVTLTANAGGNTSDTFRFAPLDYNAAGEYFYELTERQSGMTGMQYDATVYKLKVVVTDVNAVLTPAVYLYDSNSSDPWRALDLTKNADSNTWSLGLTELSFTNTFAPKRTELTLQGYKELQNGTLTNNQFTFKVTDTAGKLIVYGQNEANGKITFSSITYTESSVGEHEYFIEEVYTDNTIFYGGQKYYILVDVEVDGTNLIKTVYMDTDGDCDVTEDDWTQVPVSDLFNEQSPSDSKIKFTNASQILVTLEGTKTLVGRNMKADEFDFIVTDSNGAPVAIGSNEVGANGTPANIVFEPIGYSVSDLTKNGDVWSGTFTYTIREVKEGDDNITYDPASYTATVTITYDGSGWRTSVSYSDDVEFTNKYTPDPVSILLEIGNKTTQNAENAPSDMTFGYKVLKVLGENDDIPVGTVVATGSSGLSGKIKLTDLTFIAEGEYAALLVEENAGKEIGGVTYDSIRYLIKISVERNVDGILEISSISYHKMSDEKIAAGADPMKVDSYDETLSSADQVVFNNTYNAEGYLNITATKIITGRNGLADTLINTYEFELVNENGTPADKTDDIRHTVVAKTRKSATDDGDVTYELVFDTLTYDESDLDDEKTYIEYIMREIIPNPASAYVEYDQSEYKVTVELPAKDSVSDGTFTPTATIEQITDENGDPINDGSGRTEAVFTNVGLVFQGISFKIPMQKQLLNGDDSAREFGFVLTQIDVLNDEGTSVNESDAVEDATSVVVNSADPTDLLLDVSIGVAEKEGTYVFTLEEVNNNLGGVIYDTSVIQIKVIIKDVDNDGRLDVVKPDGTKVDLDATNGEIPVSAMVVTGRTNADGEPLFVNEYKVAPIEVTLVGHKTLNGRHMSDGEFDFELYEGTLDADQQTVWTLKSTASQNAANDGTATEIKFAKINIEAEGVYLYKIVERQTNLPDRVSPDETEYYVEVIVTDDGEGNLDHEIVYWTSSNSEEKEYSDDAIQFVNTYSPLDATVPLTGTKTLTGRDMNAREFTFHVNRIVLDATAEDGFTVVGAKVAIGRNAAAPDDATDKNTVDIVFENLPIQEAHLPNASGGMVYFQIVEEQPAAQGITIDRPVYVSVNVVKNSATGAYDIVEVKYWPSIADMKAGTNELSGANFHNVYTPNSTTTTIYAVKDLVGMTLLGDDFAFTMTETSRPEGAEANTEVYTAKNTASGEIVFALPADIYKVGGIYKYIIKENPYVFRDITVTEGTPNPNITYDPVGTTTGYEVIVEVSDDGNATLTAQVQNVIPTFTNVNDPVDLPVQIEEQFDIDKVVMDAVIQQAYDDLDGFEQFVFEVKDIQGNHVVDGYSQADGSILFDYDKDGDTDADDKGIVFTAPGVYCYSIAEKDVTDTAITKDPTTWWIEIEIETDAMGGLVIKKHFVLGSFVNDTFVSEPTQDVTEITFTNTYDADDAVVQLKGIKNMIGDRDLPKAGEFLFHLIDKDGGIAARGTTDEAGNIVFEDLIFDQAGRYEYTLVEVPSTADGVKYNIGNDQYEVVIDVTDLDSDQKYTGDLVAAVTVNGAAYDDSKIQFTNQFNEPILIPINGIVTKELTGRDLMDKEFTFVINDENGLLVAFGKNDAQGKVIFDDIKLPEGEYKLYISEQNNGLAHVTYDSTTHELIVKVAADATTGKLVVTFSKESIVFKNTYEKPVEPAPEPEDDPEPTLPPAANPDTGDTANMGLWTSLMGISLLVAAAAIIADKRRRRV